MAGLGKSLNTYDGPVPPGVPNPFTVMLHSYPTRYHGPIYTRPEFGLEWSERPNDFALTDGMNGLGEIDPSVYTPMWKVGLRDMFKSSGAIAAECNQMPGATPQEILVCAGGREVAASSARAAVAVGVALGALGMYLYKRRR